MSSQRSFFCPHMTLSPCKGCIHACVHTFSNARQTLVTCDADRVQRGAANHPTAVSSSFKFQLRMLTCQTSIRAAPSRGRERHIDHSAYKSAIYWECPHTPLARSERGETGGISLHLITVSFLQATFQNDHSLGFDAEAWLANKVPVEISLRLVAVTVFTRLPTVVSRCCCMEARLTACCG